MVFVAMKSSSSKIAIIVSPGAPRPLPQGPGPVCEAYFSNSKPRKSNIFLFHPSPFASFHVSYFYNALF